MTRRIFVGSSSEGLAKAQEVSNLLRSFADVEPVLWTTVFDPGSLTFEALETMMLQCCAAVFVATPDDTSLIRGNLIQAPRSNIVLEFGLMAGRIGRHSIALCLFGDVQLPSDLTGLTYVMMDAADSSTTVAEAQLRASKELQRWTESLLATPEMIARTEIVHGYSGRWDFDLNLDHWRGVAIAFPNYAYVKGSFDILIVANGQAGKGFAHGRLLFKLMAGAGDGHAPYQGEFRTGHEVTNAFCNTNGCLDLSTQAFAIQRMNATGAAPPELAGMEDAPEPWSARWQLSPTAEPRTLRGEVSTDNMVMTHGTARLIKS